MRILDVAVGSESGCTPKTEGTSWRVSSLGNTTGDSPGAGSAGHDDVVRRDRKRGQRLQRQLLVRIALPRGAWPTRHPQQHDLQQTTERPHTSRKWQQDMVSDLAPPARQTPHMLYLMPAREPLHCSCIVMMP